MKVKEFLINMLKGGAIGIAMIIPGVSGGTLAVLMGIYHLIINCIGNLFTDFKKSAIFLLSILLGALIAFAALYYPLKFALEYAPFPTVLLFAGFMAGSCPDLIKTAKLNGVQKRDAAAIAIPFILVIGICLIPSVKDVDLTSSMTAGGYVILLLVGMVASCALVVPGISGSMLILILGYYNPLLGTISLLKTDLAHSALVLLIFAAGLIIGFFTIAKLMQFLLKKYRRTTFWAIVGFVLGSIPAVIITFFKKYQADLSLFLSPLQIALGVILFVAGALASFFLARYAAKRTAEKDQADDGGDGC